MDLSGIDIDVLPIHRQQLHGSPGHLLRPEGAYDTSPISVVFCLREGGCENGVGGIIYGGKQGTEVFAGWPTDASTPWPSICLPPAWLPDIHRARGGGALSEESLTLLSVCSAFPVPSPPLSIYLSRS